MRRFFMNIFRVTRARDARVVEVEVEPMGLDNGVYRAAIEAHVMLTGKEPVRAFCLEMSNQIELDGEIYERPQLVGIY
jgi:hypothetical protein